MRSDSTKLVQSGLLLTLLFLTACGGEDTSCVPAPVSAPAPAPVPALVVTSMGTDFYLTLPNHLCVSNPAKCMSTPVTNKLIVAAATATTGEVTFYGVVTPFSVVAGGEVVIPLDPVIDPVTNQPIIDPVTNLKISAVLTKNEVIEDKGVHVTAISPVSVHVVSETTTSADGYLALPTAGLGTSYYVMSYASTNEPGSEFAVVATQNATTVTITPKAAGLTKPANVAFTIMLNSGQTYQFGNEAYADMTGTVVTADKPIAVFSGHRWANVPSGTGYGDYLVEQLPDVSIWGKTHHTSLFSGRTDYTVRVMASQNNTSFTSPAALSAATIGILNAGEFRDVVLTGAAEFVSDKPVLVAQFMHGYAADTAGKGDPSMVIVTPVEQAVTDSTFGVHGLAGTASTLLTGPFVNVVTETAALATLKLDNVVVNSALFAAVGGYSTGTIQVSPGVHTLVGSLPYSAMVYDYGTPLNALSYAYPVAAKITPPATPATAPVTPAAVNPSPAVCVYAQGAEDMQSNDDTEHDGHDDGDDNHHDHHDDGSHGSHA